MKWKLLLNEIQNDLTFYIAWLLFIPMTLLWGYLSLMIPVNSVLRVFFTLPTGFSIYALVFVLRRYG